MIAKYKKNILVRRLITILAVVASALLQTYVIQAFIRPANLLSSGFTGVAILIDRIASLYGHNISTSLGMLVLNIPVAILCSRSISMRFTFYSMLQVFLASFFLKICSFQPLFNDVLLDVVFGGFLYGLSIAIALRGNASTGGTDFIALYVSNKTGRSIWEYVFAGNCVILSASSDTCSDGCTQDIPSCSSSYPPKPSLPSITGMNGLHCRLPPPRRQKS